MIDIAGDGGGLISGHHNVVNELFHKHTGVASTLAVASSAGDTGIQLVSTTGFVIGDVVQINNGVKETTFPIVTALPGGNILTLDRPLDFSYSIGDQTEVVHTDLSTTIGSLASPIIHLVEPEPGKIWYIHRIILVMTHTSAATDDKFGDQSALTNGVALRSKIKSQFNTFTNWKSNSDMRLDMYDVIYTDKAGPSLFGTSARGSFSRVGVTVKLNGDNGDCMDIVVQDDITGLSSFFLNAQGYSEDL